MNKLKTNFSAKNLAFCALCCAIICVLAPLSVPIGAVPISLATFAVYLVALTVNLKISIPAVIVYILLGICGLPVFSQFRGGLGIVLGLTGGFIVGYIPATIAIGIIKKIKDNVLFGVIACLVGTVIVYVFGSIWFTVLSESTFIYAIKVCVLPFILVDLLKIAIANIVYYYIKKPIGKIIGQ